MTDTQAQAAYTKLDHVWSYLNWATRITPDVTEAQDLVATIKRAIFVEYDVEMTVRPSAYERMYKQFNRTFELR